MKDISAIVKARREKGDTMVRQVFGTHVNFEDVSKALPELFPSSATELQSLSKFFEEEMLRCRDAGAHFSGCLAGAAMIESFLLFICILEKAAVERTKTFQSSNKKNRAYEQVVVHWTLKELIPITEELEWIGPKVVDPDLITALVDGYNEMLPAAKPGITEEDLQALSAEITKRPDLALLVLMQNMRNLVHGGRCVRLRKNLASEDFSDWAKLVMVVTVEIRDCLILRLESIYRRYFLNLINTPRGLGMLAGLLGRFSTAGHQGELPQAGKE